MEISDSKYGMLLSLPGLVIIAALIIVPVIILFTTSFLQYIGWKPIVFNGIENYVSMFNDRVFWLSVRKTLIYTVGVTALTAFGGVVLALTLSEITKGSTIFRTLAMFPWAIPVVISGYIFSWVFNPDVGIFSDLLMKAGIIDSPIPVFSDPVLAMIACIIAYSWTRIPFVAIFVLAGIESVPEELHDSAKVDGADYIDRLRHVTWPFIRSNVLVATLLMTMFSFRTIDAIFSLTRGGPAKATHVLGFFVLDQLWTELNYGVGAACSVFMLLVISLVAIGYLKRMGGLRE